MTQKYQIGDRVIRNGVSDDRDDGNHVEKGARGRIIDYLPEVHKRQPYLVLFRAETYQYQWWIDDRLIDVLGPEAKQQEILEKIKYLNEKFNKSRTVPPKVEPTITPTFGTSITSAGYCTDRSNISAESLRAIADTAYYARMREFIGLCSTDAIEEYPRLGTVGSIYGGSSIDGIRSGFRNPDAERTESVSADSLRSLSSERGTGGYIETDPVE